jgi:hypothetical protein
VGNRAQDSPRARRKEPSEVRELARVEKGIDYVERRSVESYDCEPRSGHVRRVSL